MNQKLNPQEIKKLSLNILTDVDKFCYENNIVYYLACGTLLGAVRHQGFIPWDDDVDIMMPRPDYEKFLNIYKNRKYQIQKPEEGRYYYAKVYDPSTIKYEEGISYTTKKPIGIDIDVFPLDGISNDPQEFDKIMKKAKYLDTLLRLSNQKIFLRKNPIKCVNRIVPRMIGRKNIVRWYEKNAKTYSYENSEYVTRIRNTPNGFTGILKKEVYGEPVKLPFEGHLFNVPNQYKVWCKQFFGDDYMVLPPIEKRKQHLNECYRIEN